MQTLWTEISANPVGFTLLGSVICVCSLFVARTVIDTIRERTRKPHTKADAIADSLCHSMASGKEWETRHKNWVFLWKRNATPRFMWIEATRNTNDLWAPVVIQHRTCPKGSGSKVEIKGAARKRLIKAMAALHKRVSAKETEDAMDAILAGVTNTSGDKCPRCGLTKNKED